MNCYSPTTPAALPAGTRVYIRSVTGNGYGVIRHHPEFSNTWACVVQLDGRAEAAVYGRSTISVVLS